MKNLKNILIAVAIFVMAIGVQAADIVLDDFEGIADQAALDASDQIGGWVDSVALDLNGHAGQCITIAYTCVTGAPYYGSTKMAVSPSIDASAATEVTYWAKTTNATVGTAHQLNLMTLDQAALPLDYSEPDVEVFNTSFNAAGLGCSQQVTTVTSADWALYTIPRATFIANGYAFGNNGTYSTLLDWSSVDNVEYQVGAGGTSTGSFSIDDVTFVVGAAPSPSPTSTALPGEEIVKNGEFGSDDNWTTWYAETGNEGTFDFNYTADGPTTGTVPGLRVSLSFLSSAWPNIGVYQPVMLIGGQTYTPSGTFKVLNAVNLTGYLWFEMNLQNTKPADGSDVPNVDSGVNGAHLAKLSETYPGGIVGFDGDLADFNNVPAAPYVIPNTGTQIKYLLLKNGFQAEAGRSVDVVWDDISLIGPKVPNSADSTWEIYQ